MLLQTLKLMLRMIGIKIYTAGGFHWGCHKRKDGKYDHHFLGSGKVIPLSVRCWNLFQTYKEKV